MKRFIVISLLVCLFLTIIIGSLNPPKSSSSKPNGNSARAAQECRSAVLSQYKLAIFDKYDSNEVFGIKGRPSNNYYVVSNFNSGDFRFAYYCTIVEKTPNNWWIEDLVIE